MMDDGNGCAGRWFTIDGYLQTLNDLLVMNSMDMKKVFLALFP